MEYFVEGFQSLHSAHLRISGQARIFSTSFFPHGEIVVIITFVEILVALVGQGSTLPLLIKLLQIKPDNNDDEKKKGSYQFFILAFHNHPEK